jgi:hypothetical protein
MRLGRHAEQHQRAVSGERCDVGVEVVGRGDRVDDQVEGARRAPRRGVVYLVAQPREAVEEDALPEIPAGTLDREGESELDAARRELAEEAEPAAAGWTEPTRVYARDAKTLIALMALRDRLLGSD